MLEPIEIDFGAIKGYVDARFKSLKDQNLKPRKDEPIAELDCPELRRLYEYQNIHDFKTATPPFTAEEYAEGNRSATKRLGGASVKEVWDAIESIYTKGTYDKALAYFNRLVREGIETGLATGKASRTNTHPDADHSRYMKDVAEMQKTFGLTASCYVGVNLGNGWQFKRVATAYEVLNQRYKDTLPYKVVSHAELRASSNGILEKGALQYLQRRIAKGSKTEALALPVSIKSIEGTKVTTKQFGSLFTRFDVPANVKRAYWVRLRGNFFLAF
jgi:hypothetical protein